MRELIEKDKKITIVPADFKCANKRHKNSFVKNSTP